ncbi:MAG: PilZ domain-containing protein [Bacteriovoracaceae bacterium]
MPERFSLIKTEIRDPEKRILPRFPFSTMTFKLAKESEAESSSHAFQVSNISSGGMGLGLISGSHQIKKGDFVSGDLRWRENSLTLSGEVAWTNAQGFGLMFQDDMSEIMREKLDNILSLETISRNLRAIHKTEMGINIPSNLKIWLRTDGPVEIFYWTHNDNEFQKIQILVLDQYFEWEDGKGISTGEILSLKNIESPLNQSDEYSVSIDSDVNDDCLKKVSRLIENVASDILPDDAKNFLRCKL